MKRFIKNVLFISLSALLALGLSAAIASHGDRILEMGDVTLTLVDKPCEIGVILAQVEPKDRKDVKGGKVTPKAKGSPPHKLCYYVSPDNSFVAVVDEYGNSGVFAYEDFKEVPAHKPVVRI